MTTPLLLAVDRTSARYTTMHQPSQTPKPTVKFRMTTLRISQYLAACGVGSRRDCEHYVCSGFVQIRNNVVCDCATQVDTAHDDGHITVKNQPVQISSLRMFLYHKKPRTIVSRKDKRFSIFDDLREIDKGLVSVDRLDYMSEGLMIITNNGMLAHSWETSDLVRQYTVLTKLNRPQNWSRIRRECRRLCIDGVQYKPIELGSILPVRGGLHEIQVRLREGKNREIRTVWQYYGWEVRRLVRTHYGPFRLDRLRGKKYVEVRPSIPSDHER